MIAIEYIYFWVVVPTPSPTPLRVVVVVIVVVKIVVVVVCMQTNICCQITGAICRQDHSVVNQKLHSVVVTIIEIRGVSLGNKCPPTGRIPIIKHPKGCSKPLCG